MTPNRILESVLMWCSNYEQLYKDESVQDVGFKEFHRFETLHIFRSSSFCMRLDSDVTSFPFSASMKYLLGSIKSHGWIEGHSNVAQLDGLRRQPSGYHIIRSLGDNGI